MKQRPMYQFGFYTHTHIGLPYNLKILNEGGGVVRRHAFGGSYGSYTK